MAIYTVVVGNIGKVLETTQFKEMLETYGEYKRQSKENYGRAAGETVTVFQDDAVKWETQGTIDE